jgi:hypothetical protein
MPAIAKINKALRIMMVPELSDFRPDGVGRAIGLPINRIHKTTPSATARKRVPMTGHWTTICHSFVG